jgi:hypothetical protein
MLTLLSSIGFVIVAELIIILIIGILLETEHEGWATTLFSLGIALVVWNYGPEIWGFVSTNPTNTIGFIVSYLVVGGVWSIIKWRSYIKPIFEKYKEIKVKFEKVYGKPSEDNWGHWVDKLNEDKRHIQVYDEYTESFTSCKTMEDVQDIVTPKASNKKTLLISWIGYWPISLLAMLLNNPLRRIFVGVYNLLSGIYDRLSGSMARDAFKD